MSISYDGQGSCDSTLYLDETIKAIDASATSTNTQITSNAENANYQWYECCESLILLDGETNQVFSPTENGSYAVVVSQNNCSDASDCVLMSGIAK